MNQPPVSLSFAASASATSGNKGDNVFGDNLAGAKKLPEWLPLALILAAFAFGVIELVRRNN